MKPVSLVLFLSYGGSLQEWSDKGILERELLLYRELLERQILRRLYIFSYRSEDQHILEKERIRYPALSKIRLLCPKVKSGIVPFHKFWWSILGPLYWVRQIRRCDLIKTNQVSGSWAAVIAHRSCGVPFIFRMGYSLSIRSRKNGQYIRMVLAHFIELVAARLASRVFVTTIDLTYRFKSHIGRDKVCVVPPPVPDVFFSVRADIPLDAPIITVARLTSQKNLIALVNACAMMGRDLDIIGDGPDKAALQQAARSVDVSLRIFDKLENEEIAAKFSERGIFVLPSFHEGLPKALMEAMAAGLSCAGSDIPGIRECIQHGRTGYLINGFDAEDIAATLNRLIDENDRALGQNARQFAHQKFGLNICAERETRAYRDLVQ